MAFTPDKPESLTDLFCFFDPDLEEVAILIYESDEGSFYRDKSTWKEISDEDDSELDIDGLIIIYVNPEFIDVYDEADQEDLAISYEDTIKYQSIDLVKE